MQTSSPIVVSVAVVDGIVFSLLGVCPWVEEIVMVCVFSGVRETVLIELSEAVLRMAVLFFGDSVADLLIGFCFVSTIRTQLVRVTGTLVFFFRLRPLPPRFPRLVFLLRFLFFFFLASWVISAVVAGAAHSGRTPTETVCSAPANGLCTASALALFNVPHCGRTPPRDVCSAPARGRAPSQEDCSAPSSGMTTVSPRLGHPRSRLSRIMP